MIGLLVDKTKEEMTLGEFIEIIIQKRNMIVIDFNQDRPRSKSPKTDDDRCYKCEQFGHGTKECLVQEKEISPSHRNGVSKQYEEDNSELYSLQEYYENFGHYLIRNHHSMIPSTQEPWDI